METGTLLRELERYAAAREAEFGAISSERRAGLERLSTFARERASTGKPVRLVFVCTHNSRRSQMAQLWAGVGAQRYGVDARTYSGGTEATAFNERAVESMRRAGFAIEAPSGGGANPRYGCGWARVLGRWFVFRRCTTRRRTRRVSSSR